MEQRVRWYTVCACTSLYSVCTVPPYPPTPLQVAVYSRTAAITYDRKILFTGGAPRKRKIQKNVIYIQHVCQVVVRVRYASPASSKASLTMKITRPTCHSTCH